MWRRRGDASKAGATAAVAPSRQHVDFGDGSAKTAALRANRYKEKGRSPSWHKNSDASLPTNVVAPLSPTRADDAAPGSGGAQRVAPSPPQRIASRWLTEAEDSMLNPDVDPSLAFAPVPSQSATPAHDPAGRDSPTKAWLQTLGMGPRSRETDRDPAPGAQATDDRSGYDGGLPSTSLPPTSGSSASLLRDRQAKLSPTKRSSAAAASITSPAEGTDPNLDGRTASRQLFPPGSPGPTSPHRPGPASPGRAPALPARPKPGVSPTIISSTQLESLQRKASSHPSSLTPLTLALSPQPSTPLTLTLSPQPSHPNHPEPLYRVTRGGSPIRWCTN